MIPNCRSPPLPTFAAGSGSIAGPMIDLKVRQGDITRLAVDAIVNAANQTLLGGGGVDGAIHRAAGPELLAECATIGGCPTGQSRITLGYNLPARHVIHTVGPIWQGGRLSEAALLRSCYVSALELAEDNELVSIAFPAISTGAFGYPPEPATRIAIDTVTGFPAKSLKRVSFVCFDAHTAAVYGSQLSIGDP
jgi:O-acetyl-ADP-ribose deacetylase (regulator of RNase III)